MCASFVCIFVCIFGHEREKERERVVCMYLDTIVCEGERVCILCLYACVFE